MGHGRSRCLGLVDMMFLLVPLSPCYPCISGPHHPPCVSGYHPFILPSSPRINLSFVPTSTVLFTLSKEKVDTSPRFTVFKYLLEFIQLLFLFAHPSFGWHIDQNNM